MSNYLLIKPSEDGEPCTFLDSLEDLLNNPEDYGVREFRDFIPKEDPNYWADGEALLLEVKVLKPQARTVAFRLD